MAVLLLLATPIMDIRTSPYVARRGMPSVGLCCDETKLRGDYCKGELLARRQKVTLIGSDDTMYM